MRKIIVSAAAASVTLALAGGAVAQVSNRAGDATFDATVSGNNAGTKKKPTGHSLRTVLSVSRPGTTVEVIQLNAKNGLKFTPKGLKTCSKATLEDLGPTACSKASSAGPQGSATAVIEPGGAPLNFEVFPFVGNSKTIYFYLNQVGGGVQATLDGTITNGGQRLSITIPLELRQPAGLDATLTGIDQTFRAKSGKRNLISSTACKGGSWTVGGTLIFATRSNGTPGPPTESLNEKVSCKK